MIATSWTPIATRSRLLTDKNGYLTWSLLADAPIGISEAHRLAANGLLIMANRHYDDVVELVVRAVSRG